MKNQKIQTLKGFRDFLPEEKRRRDFVVAKIKKTFEIFGFEPLETPTLEYSKVILGKYGDEADKMVYSFKDRGNRNLSLRYDQTVPTARVLAQYQSKLPKFFRRYQIQNVFRADKPQKGRFREFTQCDADIYNTTSPLADAEILAVYYAIYQNLGFKNITIKYNDRTTLFNAFKPFESKKTSVLSIIQSVDKLDKLSPAQVINELKQKGLDQSTANKILKKLTSLKPTPNLSKIISLAKSLGIPEKVLQFSPELARGLDYYTGLIFEGSISDYSGGSVGGGGRYDNLIKQLSGADIPAVGFGLGFDRTVEAATELNLIPTTSTTSKVLVANLNLDKNLKATQSLRQKQIPTEIYPETDKLSKQLKYANQKGIPFVLILGPDEIKQNLVTLKDMRSGKQTSLPLEKAIEKLT